MGKVSDAAEIHVSKLLAMSKPAGVECLHAHLVREPLLEHEIGAAAKAKG